MPLPKLAIEGGTPSLPEAPFAWPVTDDLVREALLAAWSSGDWGRYHGPATRQLAAELAAYYQTDHAWLCSSGTLAVELALRGLSIAVGDEVILAGYDFAGNFRAVEAVGARPVLVDIDPATWCLDAEGLDAATSPLTRAVIVSHLHSGLAAIQRICDWAAERDIAVVEDACQATGATVAGRRAGSWGTVGVLSFGGSKLLTAGRGGALLTRQAEILQRIKIYCEHGNNAYPLSELQAAVLLPQLAQLDARNHRRRAAVARLRAAIGKLSGLQSVAPAAAGDEVAYYKLAWLAPEAQAAAWLAALEAEGAPFGAGFRGFAGRSERRCRAVGPLTHCRAAAAGTLLLHHPILLEPDDVIDRLAGALQRVAEVMQSNTNGRGEPTGD